MYSASHVAVDKGLGFDFSAIADIVKAALPVSLNIYQQQTQLAQIKKMQQAGYAGGYVPQSPSIYGMQYGQLPMSASMTPQPTFGRQYPQPSTGMDATTMALIGIGALVAGLLAYKAIK